MARDSTALLAALDRVKESLRVNQERLAASTRDNNAAKVASELALSSLESSRVAHQESQQLAASLVQEIDAFFAAEEEEVEEAEVLPTPPAVPRTTREKAEAPAGAKDLQSPRIPTPARGKR